MQQSAIQFETYEVAVPPDPARMDVTAFVGYVTPRSDAVVPTHVRDGLAQTYGDDGLSLLNRPVRIGSVAMFEALFLPDDRLAALAQLTGGPLAATLPRSGVATTLTLIVNGILHDLDLSPLPATPSDAVLRITDAIAAAGLPVTVELDVTGTAQALTFTLNPLLGRGTLAVLTYPTLGFAQTARAEARLLPSPMALGVRQYFASGGQTAVIVALGTPPAYDPPRAARMAALKHLTLGGARTQTTSLGAFTSAIARGAPFAPIEPAQWHGVQHLISTPDVTFICLPDLAELAAPRPRHLPDLPAPAAPDEVFTECLPPAGTSATADAHRYGAPDLDAVGALLWSTSVHYILGIISTELRDKFVIAALPRPQAGAALPRLPDSAFLQIAEGWVRSFSSTFAPEGLMAPDAVLAGHLARQSRAQGTFLSAASQPILGVRDVEIRPSADRPTCKLTTDLRGIMLSADLTTSRDSAWADAPVSRLMALLRRECLRLGQAMTFEPSGPALWQTIRTVLRGLMQAVYRSGALAGTGNADSFEVICDRTTMSEQDIQSGRLIAELSFLPARPVARITVRLPLASGGRST